MADTIFNHVSCAITLQTSASPTVSYKQAFFCDSTDVPVDVRYQDVVRSGYTTDLTSTENTYKFAAAFWSQKRTADYLRVCRWVSAATSPFFVCGDHETTLATWVAVTDASFTVTTTAGADAITACTFASCTSMADVAAAIDAKIVSGNVSKARCTIDALDRIIFTDVPVTGPGANTVVVSASGAGTDITVAAYLDVPGGHQVAGLAIETPSAAIAAVSAIDDDYYDIAFRGESAAQQLTLAATVEALDKQLTLVTGVAADKSAISTTDAPYLLNALGYDNTMIMYTEHTITAVGGWVDAAVQGAVLPAKEGSTAWSFEKLSGVYASGQDYASSPIALTAAEKLALENKNCNWFETVGNDTYMYPGLNCSGEEKRIILGRHWMQNSIVADVASYKLNNALPAFDDKTLTGFERIIRQYLTEALVRGIIIDTAARPITLDMPIADDFTAAQRASHTMTLSDVFNAYINSVVNDVDITGELRI